jgi:membrane-bound lytic murein transglycosylase MltF
VLVLLFVIGCGDVAEESPVAPSSAAELQLWSDTEPRMARLLTPRFDDPLEREPPIVRVLVSYSATNFFVDSGRPRGLEYELMRGFEAFLAERSETAIPPRLVFIALPFDRVIQGVAEGRGDVAAAGLTITEDRRRSVSFSEPYRRSVREVVVRHHAAAAVPTVEALSGRVVRVVSGSSYATHLVALNRNFRAQGRAPVIVEMVDASLQAEDVLQLVHSGAFPYTVVDDHLAGLWSRLLDGLVVENASVNEGGKLAWALRQDAPRLQEALDAYGRSRKHGTLHGNMLFRRYHENTRWIRDLSDAATKDRLEHWRPLFERYGEQYGFDWIALASIAVQESGLDPHARSSAGAVGLMQVRPATAADPNVGIEGIETDPEANIHAATRYLAFLRGRYFDDPAIPPAARFDFTVAAYNAGPAAVRRLRAAAARDGFDPDVWFGSVEHAARRSMGRETVEYVGNVNKYYVALRTAERRQAD